MDAEKVIHCIGDSHASFFSGYDRIQPEYPAASDNKYPFFKSYRLGAVLAYNLGKLGTKEKGREKLLSLIQQLKPGSTILLCFGEIDCRCHLIKQAQLQKRTLQEIVDDCVSKYAEVVLELQSMGFSVMLWNVIPSSESNNEEYPAYGTVQERNNVTVLFNSALAAFAGKQDITFLSIFEKLTDSELRTRKIFLFDAIHLGQLAMPLLLGKMKKTPSCLPYVAGISRLYITKLGLHLFVNYKYLCFKRKLAGYYHRFKKQPAA